MSIRKAPAGARPIVIGMAGAIGSGKSTVAETFAGEGAVLIDADAIAHSVIERPDIKEQIVKRWGQSLLDPDHRIVRARLAQKAFEDPREVRALEALIHPPVRMEIEREIDAARRAANAAVVVIDAPLLFEAELDARCHAVVFVDAPFDLRLSRVARARGWDRAELQKREKAQWPAEEKKKRADYVLVNLASTENLQHQARALFRSIVQRLSSNAERRTQQLWR